MKKKQRKVGQNLRKDEGAYSFVHVVDGDRDVIAELVDEELAMFPEDGAVLLHLTQGIDQESIEIVADTFKLMSEVLLTDAGELGFQYSQIFGAAIEHLEKLSYYGMLTEQMLEGREPGSILAFRVNKVEG